MPGTYSKNRNISLRGILFEYLTDSLKKVKIDPGPLQVGVQIYTAYTTLQHNVT